MLGTAYYVDRDAFGCQQSRQVLTHRTFEICQRSRNTQFVHLNHLRAPFEAA